MRATDSIYGKTTVRAMDVTAALALAAAINHELAPLVQELMLDRERKAMQLEDLAVQGMTGKFFANMDLQPLDEGETLEEPVGDSFITWDALVTDYAEALYPNRGP